MESVLEARYRGIGKVHLWGDAIHRVLKNNMMPNKTAQKQFFALFAFPLQIFFKFAPLSLTT